MLAVDKIIFDECSLGVIAFGVAQIPLASKECKR